MFLCRFTVLKLLSEIDVFLPRISVSCRIIPGVLQLVRSSKLRPIKMYNRPSLAGYRGFTGVPPRWCHCESGTAEVTSLLGVARSTYGVLSNYSYSANWINAKAWAQLTHALKTENTEIQFSTSTTACQESGTARVASQSPAVFYQTGKSVSGCDPFIHFPTPTAAYHPY